MKIRVTFFEDNAALNRALQQMISDSNELELAGAFTNGNNVLRDIAKSNPDVVLMDIDMPGINGIESVKIIRSQFPNLRILMQTVFDDDDKIFESILAGASGYILKK
jgi:DNA-binding NarL/FixJ family response regulator